MSFSVWDGERKYFSSTVSSRMSDNEHALSILWDAEVRSVKHFPFAVLPQFIHRTEDGVKGSTFIVVEESDDVLSEQIAASENRCEP
jgi:hypothetical protein